MDKEERVWLVSFRVAENGDLSDYQVEEADLREYDDQTAAHLRAKLGNGVFHRADEAQAWARRVLQGREGGCCGGCGCCHQR